MVQQFHQKEMNTLFSAEAPCTEICAPAAAPLFLRAKKVCTTVSCRKQRCLYKGLLLIYWYISEKVIGSGEKKRKHCRPCLIQSFSSKRTDSYRRFFFQTGRGTHKNDEEILRGMLSSELLKFQQNLMHAPKTECTVIE